MGRFRVLVVDDEERILNFLKSKLKASGYDVFSACNGFEGIEQVQSQNPDLVVLDVVMPRMDGFEALKQIRSFSKVPVIVLSARGADMDKIRGLGLGADDYLPKPFNPEELIARIEAVRRRIEPGGGWSAEVFKLGNLTVEFDSRRVLVNGEERYLTRIEWLLLSELTRNAGRLMPYEVLLSRVWGPEYCSDVQLLRTWISRLRFKIEGKADSPKLIHTIAKTGYTIGQSPA